MSLRIGILTSSDRVSRGQMADIGGEAIERVVRAAGWHVVKREVLPDDDSRITATLCEWCDEVGLDVVVTTGGTGLGPRDVMPEATLAVADRIIPGISETIRATSLANTPTAMISRGVAVTRGTTLIVNVPGSPQGAVESLETVLPVLEHAVSIMHGGNHPGDHTVPTT